MGAAENSDMAVELAEVRDSRPALRPLSPFLRPLSHHSLPFPKDEITTQRQNELEEAQQPDVQIVAAHFGPRLRCKTAASCAIQKVSIVGCTAGRSAVCSHDSEAVFGPAAAGDPRLACAAGCTACFLFFRRQRW